MNKDAAKIEMRMAARFINVAKEDRSVAKD
jgi:hypothetical protein